MEVELKLEPGREEPKLIICAGADTPELRDLAEQLRKLELAPIALWDGEQSFPAPQNKLLRFFTQGKGVSAQTTEGIYEVRLRLYELEERLDRRRFVRISNSEIINLDHVTAVDLSISGTICMTLDKTVTAYVSRRYVKKIKETLNLGRRERR